MLIRKFMIGIFAAAALAGSLARPLYARWGDIGPQQPAAQSSTDARQGDKPADPAAQAKAAAQVADKASWSKYSFSLPLADGSGDTSFADLASSGKPFVLVWWLSDCPVCNMEMPYVKYLAHVGAEKEVGVQVVGINIDQDDSSCNDYIKNKHIDFDILRDPRGRHTDEHYGIRNEGTPMTYVFKAGGDFAGKLSGYTKNYPDRVLSMLGIKAPEKPAGNGVSVERADGTHETRSFE